MKTTAPIIALFMMTNILLAQDVFKEVFKAGYGDIAATKQKAEAGDPQAQLSLADTLAYNFKKADALPWYRKAADNGLTEAKSRLGELLLFGGSGTPTTQTVPANPTEGIRWLFDAATNGDSKAYFNLSKAFQNGIGVDKNLIEAYAWLQLYTDQNELGGRVLLNQLGLSLDANSLQQAQILASEYKSGHWPDILPRKIPQNDPRLKLEGIIFGSKIPLATINGKTLSEGDSADILIKKENLKIKITCLQIKEDSVLISVDGEKDPRWLYAK